MFNVVGVNDKKKKPTLEELLQMIYEFAKDSDFPVMSSNKLDKKERHLSHFVYEFKTRKNYSVRLNNIIAVLMFSLTLDGRPVKEKIRTDYKTALERYGKDPERGYLD